MTTTTAVLLCFITISGSGPTLLSAGAERRVAAPAQDATADVAGTWGMTIDFGQGTGTPNVTFKQDGEKLTGTYSSQVVGEHQITGTIKGNAITFGFTGNIQGNNMTVTFTGTVEKDSMKGKVNFGDVAEGTFTGKKK
jgi:hypothetical protein